MSPRVWGAIAALVVGIPLAAWGLAKGSLLFGLLGLALVLVFVFLVSEAIAQANRPQHRITPAENSAWSMKDPAAPTNDKESP